MIVGEALQSKVWRMSNLYRVIDKAGQSVPFVPNAIQRKVLDCPHARQLILKARQVGMSTLAILSVLDDVIFTPYLAAGVVSYSLEHAQYIVQRIIGHALDTFPDRLKSGLGITSRSARQISFSNGSFIRVDTTLRGGTYRKILVSEFGKTCARYPTKADEIVSGTINAVPADGQIIIESTGEGLDGYFAEWCLDANERAAQGEAFGPLDWHLQFFPWFMQAEYALSQTVKIDYDLEKYFDSLRDNHGIELSIEQKYWYAQQTRIQGDRLKQEFPSTPVEAFLSRSDAYFFAEYVKAAYDSNRCVYTSIYDPVEPVHVAMDLGVNDLTVLVYFQCIHGEIRIIDSYFDNNKGVDFYVRHMLQDKPYIYHTIFLPHDARKRNELDPRQSSETEVRRLLAHTNTTVRVLQRTDKQESISYAKSKFNRCVFDVSKCKFLLDHLSKYRKTWHEPTGQYLETPLHDEHSHYADAFRYAMQAVGLVETGFNKSSALEKHKAAIDARRLII